MGALKDDLKQRFKVIFEDLNPRKTAEQKAEELASAIEEVIMRHVKVYIPSGSVVVQVTGQATGIPNSGPIQCVVRDE